MLIQLADFLSDFYSGFNLFQYITLRSVLAAITAMLVSVAAGPYVIRYLASIKVGQPVRTLGPASHQSKRGTPTMGGLLIVPVIVVSTLLWSDIYNRYILIALATTVLFAVIGGIDDYLKLRRGDSEGMSKGRKFLWQSVTGFAVGAGIWYTAQSPAESVLIVPFVKQVMVDLGPVLILLAWLTIVGSSNGVNLTDGLDGLAVMPVVLIAAALGVFAYVSGHANFSDYLALPHLPLASELTVFCGALAGAGLGFLWFNTYPAQIFMGDVGSLSLGAALGVIAVLVRQELVLLIMGGVFVLEAVSVMLQVASFKSTGRRVFKMAPLHHHFELRGQPEPRVIVRFWIIALLLVLVGLATLKIR